MHIKISFFICSLLAYDVNKYCFIMKQNADDTPIMMQSDDGTCIMIHDTNCTA